MNKYLVKIFFDGSCYNGKRIGKKSLTQVDKSMSTMGIGVVSVVKDKVHKQIKISGGLGTNNVAEWLGGVYALTLAREYYETYYDVEVRIYTDSQLIANQFNGVWKIKEKEFLELYRECKSIAKEMPVPERVRFNWIPREQNKIADKLSKEANPYYRNKLKIKA